jgi:chemotaxis-related protein WspD
MRTDLEESRESNSAADACWNRIGVHGDRSCDKLTQAVHCRNCPAFSRSSQQLLEREAPQEYIDDLTRQLAESEQDALEETRSFLVFRVGDEWLALDVHCVVEVVEPRIIHRIPHRTDRRLQGVANVRGELHLCISLHELLGIEGGTATALASSTASNPRLVVAQLSQQRWAFSVDEVDGIHRITQSALENLPHTVEKSGKYFSESLFQLKGARVAVLSEMRLIPALERVVR